VVAKRILTCIFLAAISFLAACGGSSSSPSSSSQAAVSIALSPAPSSTTIAAGSTTGIQFMPVVNGDPGNNGVDWALTCSSSMPGLSNVLTNASVSNPCGALSICSATGTCAMHSASGTAVTYTPPLDLIGGNLTVNVTAFATANHSENVSTPVTVSSYVSALSGTYVFQVQGNNGGAYQIMGVLVLDGKGNITAGQETVNNTVGTTTPAFSTAYTLQPASTAASNYFIGPDGRGIITANFQPVSSNSTVSAFTETFSMAVISSSEALIAEDDLNCSVPPSGTCPAPNQPFGATGFGTLELQDATAASTLPSGAYAFVTSGTDSNSSTGPNSGSGALPTAIGGIFNIDNNPAAGDISGNGSLADQNYLNSNLVAKLFSCVPSTGLTGSVSQPSSMGVVTITLTGPACFGTPATIQFSGYIVDSQHVRLIETDDVSGAGGYLTSGIAVSQGSAAGTFTNASLSGAYVFGILGFDGATFGATPASFTSVGTLTSNGNTSLSGITDTFYNVESIPLPASTLTGSYTLDTYGAGGTAALGRADLDLKFSVPSGDSKPKPTILFYLTGNGTAPLVMYAGDSDPNYPAVGAGIAYPQATANVLNFGNPEAYGINFTQYNSPASAETDGSGSITSQQNSQPPPQWELTGTADDTSSNDFLGSILPTLDGYSPPADSFGRMSGTFLNNFVSGSSGPFYEYYLVDDNHGFFVETDLASSSQTSLGYFAQACDVTSTTSCQQAAAASKHSVRQGSARSRKKNLR
jgi:hypothetical protein